MKRPTLRTAAAWLCCFSLSPWLGGMACGQAASQVPAKAPSANPQSTGTPSASDRFAADAAARHAKRTQCLKDAKAKKLVGGERTAYVKDCMGPAH